MLAGGTASAAPAGWWNDQWEGRIPIVVEASEGLLSKRPVVTPWSEIAESLGDARVRVYV